MKPRSNTAATPPQMKPKDIQGFHRALHIWYQLHGRHDLPWRTTKDAYAIWLSEVMLQQTQVATVRDRYYGQFLRQFPTISALARAPLPKLLKAWEGMGYYSRARNLHKAAGLTAPSLPTDYAGLLALPGIGKNTAHAILSFAYRKPYPVLEANVKRVVARIVAETDEKNLWDHADALLDRENPFDYNQAMMDLGAMICTPKNPKCPECPAMQICKGKKNPTAFPTKKTKKAVPTKHVYIVVKRDPKRRLFLEARDVKLLGGLYGFAQQETAPKGSKYLGHVKHVYSHFKLEAEVMIVDAPASNSPDWHTREQIKKLPLSKVDLKVLELLD